MKKLFLGIALAAVTTISLTACGSSSDAVATQAKSSLAKELTANATSASDPFKEAAAANCMANGVVDKVGVKALIGYGMIDAKGNATGTQFNGTKAATADATAFIDSLLACAGDKLTSNYQANLARSQASAPAKVKLCLSKLATKDTIRAVLMAQTEGNKAPEAMATLTNLDAKAKACAATK